MVRNKMKKVFTDKNGAVNDKLRKWLEKQSDIEIESLSGDQFKVEIFYERK